MIDPMAGPGAPMDPLAPLPPAMSMDPIETGENEQVIDREEPEINEARKALVNKWEDRVRRAKTHWEPSFKRMRDDMDFASGLQWSKDRNEKRYTANVTLRMVAQKTAFLYAKNPKAVAKRREKLMNTVWDGTQTQLEQMQQSMMMAQQAGMMGDPMVGMPPSPEMMQAQQQAMAVMQEVQQIREANRQMDAVAKTLELLYQYNVEEQTHPFKQMMKMVVRRTITTGVGYVKLGFQRVMGKRPEIEAKIADASQRLMTLERLSSDMADQQFEENSAEAEQLRLLVADLSQQVEFITREGLTFDYPGSTTIIPDVKTVHLREFLGSDWVAEEFILTPEEVQEIYGVDVGKTFTAYSKPITGDVAQLVVSQMSARSTSGQRIEEKGSATVWEIYSRKDGLVYVVCEGYPDFLREPASPDMQIERFYPWFALAFNECEHETDIFPPSDVTLMRDMQLEYNRARQGLREHRIAARPKTIVSSGMLDEEDLAKLSNHPANAVIEINGLQPGQDVKTVLQPFTGPGVDPNLYEVNEVYSDVQRTTGVQEANLGGTSNGTATESQIAESSRQTSMGSNIDDLDDLLTQLAHSGGQVLLKEVSLETAQKIVGPGAVWPQLSMQDIAEDLWLEIEAGSTGRPNQAQEIANAERLMPLLFQIPNMDPEFLAEELLRRMDDKLDLQGAFKPMNPSIVLLNSMKAPVAPGAGAGPGQPAGPAGAANGGPQPPGQGGSPPPDQVQAMAGAPPPGGMN